MALSVQNTVAVLQGIFGHRSAFVRTPKYAGNKAPATVCYSQKKNKMHFFELLVLLYYVGGIGLSIYLNDFFFLVLFLMMSAGLAVVIFWSYEWQKKRWPFVLPKLRWRRLLFLFKYN